jgi:hypothetical protein
MSEIAKKREQIEAAREVLPIVRSLIELDRRECDRNTVLGEYRNEVYGLALRAIRDVDADLSKAEMASYSTAHVTKVDDRLFDFVRSFRQIGPRKLAELLDARQPHSSTHEALAHVADVVGNAKSDIA